MQLFFLLCGSILSGIVWGNNWTNNDQTFYTKSSRINDNSRGSGYIIDLNTATSYPHQNLTIYGADTGDNAGSSVATGDVNGDGIEDIIIGAPGDPVELEVTGKLNDGTAFEGIATIKAI